MRGVAPAVLARPGPAAVREFGTGPAPEDVFRVLAGKPGAFFLDSAGGPAGLSRWSFLGGEPFLVIEATDRGVVEMEAGRRRQSSENPLTALRRTLERFRLPPCESHVPFTAGAVGYLGYDLKHSVERLPRLAARDQSFPDMRLGLYDRVLAHDGESDRWYAAAAPVGAGLSAGAERTFGDLARILDAASRLPPLELPPVPARERVAVGSTALSARGGPVGSTTLSGRRGPVGSTTLSGRRGIRANMSRERYLRAVERVIEYIAAGDIFQANFTQRFECLVGGEPAELYCRLRRRNPAPFAGYLDAGEGRAVLSSSPERFLTLRGRRVETRPIKGTRPRGSTPEEDRCYSRELLASEKDAAELAMIVDLERNDLGRVADYGSVRVTEARTLEEYPTVFHLVATVTGLLAEGRDRVDLLRATFPGGSITGAPKIRAMEIIEELEPTARSVYTGAMGCLGFEGGLDLNIVIRTMLWEGPRRGGTPGRVTYQVGGGIVADSDPSAEYEECLAKGRALAEALGVAAAAEGRGPGRGGQQEWGDGQ